MDIENAFNQSFALFDLCATTNVIPSSQITLIMTFPVLWKQNGELFQNITTTLSHVPYFAIFKPIITFVKTWKTVSLLQSLLRIHGCSCWKCAIYIYIHLSECQKTLLKRILYFSSNHSVTNNHSGDKQVHLLLWSWLKLCFQDECLNIIRLIQILNLYCHKWE